MLIGLAVGFLVIVAEDSAAVERPTKPGPYNAGYFDETLNATRDGRLVYFDCRYYYPATTNGEGADPDTSGAPYPPIIYHIFFDGQVDSDKWNRTCDRERIEFVVSHGFVVLTFTPIHYAGPPPGVRSEYNDLVYHTDKYDANASSPLYGMIKKDAYGALGEHWGGGVSFVHACTVDRITVVHSMGIVFGEYIPTMHDPYTRDWNKTDRVWMVQMGGSYTMFDSALRGQYEVLDPGKSIITLPGGGQRGPWRDDLMIAFFLFHLGGDEEYETFLYGNESKNEVYTGQYEMEYELADGRIFNWDPEFITNIPTSCNMDEDLTFEVTCDDPNVLLSDPTLMHEWYVGDLSEPYSTSTTDSTLNIIFTEQGRVDYVMYKYKIGLVEHTSEISAIIVRNVWPVADAGPDQTILHDEPAYLDGSRSHDTPSDNETLEYNWSVLGLDSGWSDDPRYEIDTSVLSTFTASLLVRDRHGRVSSSSDSVTISIINVAPSATVGEDMTVEEDEVVDLIGAGTDTPSHVDTLEFRWAYGDGTSSDWSANPIISHAFKQNGTFTVTFQVRDLVGTVNGSTLSVTVVNLVPTAGIGHPEDGTKADVNTMIEFTCWGNDTPSDNVSLWYTWDFGDGRTADGPEVSHTYDEAGNYEVTLTVEDDDGATAVMTLKLTIEEAPSPVGGPVVFTVTTGLLAMVLIAFVTITEPGKYWIGLMGSPLFIKTEDVLDNKTRHALLGVIVTNPGIHYTAIKQEFGLANGQAAYHLDVLERESIIRSVRDGRLKRFFSARAKVPRDELRSPEETREAIVELVDKRPGISQLEVMDELGIDRDSASYYLRDLVKEGRLKAGREGKFTVYRVGRRVR